VGEEEHLIAVAGSATDSTSSVCEAADQTIRREIEGFAHVIVASSAAQPEFWLGQRDLFETVRVAAEASSLRLRKTPALPHRNPALLQEGAGLIQTSVAYISQLPLRACSEAGWQLRDATLGTAPEGGS
jgi:hypothetical protein